MTAPADPPPDRPSGPPAPLTEAPPQPPPEPPADPNARFTLEMTPERLGELRQAIRTLVARCGLPDEVGQDAEIAVDEAIQNVMRHAYHGHWPARVDLTVWVDEGVLWTQIRDYADPVDLQAIRPRDWDPDRPGGLGVRLIAAVMDHVVYAHAPDGNGNTVTLGRRLARSSNEGNEGG